MYESPTARPQGKRADRVILAVLATLGVFLLFIPEDTEVRVSQELRSTVLAPFLAAHRAVEQSYRMGERLAALQAERDTLDRELAEIRAELLGLREKADLGELDAVEGLDVVAGVIRTSRGRTSRPRVFEVEAGREEGISPPAGVFTGRGLVGVVRTTTGSKSRGEFWTHPDFRVSVRTADGATSGIVRALHEGRQPVMLLEGAPYQQEIEPGTRLVTSGLGGVFPPGVAVGTVRSVAFEEEGWSRSYLVEPAMRPEATTVVLVWRSEGEESRDSAESRRP